jgi:hypothetical protein
MELYSMDERLDYTVPKDESLFPHDYKAEKITLTIRGDIKRDFDVLCKNLRLNRSQTVQLLMQNFTKNNKGKEISLKA